jgi:putative hydrolase of the HAD superfamily
VTLRAVIFDWGGTLSRWAEVDLEDLWRAAARRLHPEDPEDLLRELIAVEQRFWEGVESTQRSGHLSELLQEATSALRLDVAEAVLEEAATYHLDAWTPHIRHDPEAGGVLRELRARGLKTGLLSNTLWPRAFHERFLQRDGLAELLDARLYTSDLPRTKPHPSAFRAVLDELGISEPAEAVFVGDRPFDDVGGAKGVGMRAVLRPSAAEPKRAGPEPDAVIEDLPSLLPLLDEWQGVSR